MWLRVLDELRGITHRMAGQHAVSAERAARMTIRFSVIERGLCKLTAIITDLAEAKKEEALGPIVYEITSGDLFTLSARHRGFVCNSGAVCLNDICVTRLMSYEGMPEFRPCESDIDKIMDWKRACVMRITEAQVVEAIDAQQAVDAAQRGGN
jgi:hypothetical protein